MRKEVSQGLGVVAVAVLFGVLWLVTDNAVMRLGTVLFAVIGLGMVAYGLLAPARSE
jgi:hypothetical protein